jgi:hypothetical protein
MFSADGSRCALSGDPDGPIAGQRQPGRRRLVAIKGETVPGAWDADTLASQIVAEQIAEALRDEQT